MNLRVTLISLALWLPQSTFAEPIPGTTGQYNVGIRRFTIDFVNTGDPIAPGNVTTEYLATIFYPTKDSPSPPTPYIEPELAQMYTDVSGLNISHLTSTNRWNASFLSKPTGPTLLFGPGGWGPPADGYTILLSDLASHGYVVAALDHPYEQPFLRFPNGTSLVGLPLDYDFGNNIAFLQDLHAVRVREQLHFISYWPQLVSKLCAPFETKGFGTFGHSLGGSAALNTALENKDVAAAINQDGSIWEPASLGVPSSDLGRPSLLLGFEGHNFEIDSSWLNYTKVQSGWWRSLSVNGAKHSDWSDVSFWKIWGINGTPSPIDGWRMTNLTRTYIRAFFDKHLQGLETPIFDGPSSDWPEVVYDGSSDE